MGRVPISVRLAGLIAAAFLLLLAIVGLVVHRQLGDALRESLDQRLIDAAATLTPDLDQSGEDDEIGGLELTERDVQLVDRGGRVVAATDELEDEPVLLAPADLAAARRDEPVVRTVVVPEVDDEPLRVLAVEIDDLRSDGGDGGGLVAIVAADLEPVQEAQEALLAVYGPVALLASSLAGLLGYAVARRGLSPIGQMTSEADEIGASDLTRRLSGPERLDEVGRLAATLNGMLDRVEAAIARERAFTADASHELRTPLAILRAEVELARNRASDADVRTGLSSALEEADRLAGLIDDLLVLARAEGDALPDRAMVDLGELAEAVTSRFLTLAGQRQVGLTAAGAAVVHGEISGLERAVSNLVDNAVRHTPPGGTVRVEVEGALDGSARLTVTDTGPGVPADQVDRLFERFSRIDGARNQPGGAGLGLAIVAAVAAAHHGRAFAVNRSEGGLLTTLELPAIEAKTAAG